MAKGSLAEEEKHRNKKKNTNWKNQDVVEVEEEEEAEEENVQKKKKEKKGKTGVCYLSRIPPHMKPLKLRHLLSQFGDVGRIYLAPEDSAVRMRRKRAGGNSGKNFTEGWVEFLHKRHAKHVAAMLNGESMEARRRSAYHYDLWNIKYLPKFKWDNLTEEIAYKKAVREQKLAAEISAAKKERDFYLSRVDQAGAIDSMAERRRKRNEGSQKLDSSSAAANSSTTKDARIVRHFSQRRSMVDPTLETKPRLASDILAQVFGSLTQ